MKTGKQTKINIEANKKLKALYLEKEITRCEACNSDFGLTFAHRHKRRWYRGQSESLSDFNQTLLLCLKCHIELEVDKELTERTFVKLRGEKNGYK